MNYTITRKPGEYSESFEYNYNTDKSYLYNGQNIKKYQKAIRCIYIFFTLLTILIEILCLATALFFVITYTTQAFTLWVGLLYIFRIVSLFIALFDGNRIYTIVGNPKKTVGCCWNTSISSGLSMRCSLSMWFILVVITTILFILFLIVAIILAITSWNTMIQVYVIIVLVVYIILGCILPSIYFNFGIKSPVKRAYYRAGKKRNMRQRKMPYTRTKTVRVIKNI